MAVRAAGWAFLGMAATAGVFITYMSPSYFYTPRALDNVILVLQPFLAATVIHLAAVFPERRAFFSRRPELVAIPYFVSLILAIVTRASASRISNVPEALLTTVHLYLFGSLVAFFATTLLGYRKSAAVAVRVQSSVILAGIVVATIIPGLELLTNQVLKRSLFPDPIRPNLEPRLAIYCKVGILLGESEDTLSGLLKLRPSRQLWRGGTIEP